MSFTNCWGLVSKFLYSMTPGKLAWTIHETWVSQVSSLAWLWDWRQSTLSLFFPVTSSWFHPFNLLVPIIPKWGKEGKRMRERHREILMKITNRENVSHSCLYSFLLDLTLFLLAFQRPPAGLSRPSLPISTTWDLKEKVNTNPLHSSHQISLHLGILLK